MALPDGLVVRWAAIGPGAVRRDVAWELLRGILPPAAVLSNPCPRCGGPHGPVRIDDAAWRASVSYAGGLAVVAAMPSDGVSGFGLDAEAGEPEAPLALDRVLGTPRAASVRDWTRIEAALKADGRGLRVDPGRVTVDVDGDGWTATVPDAAALRGADVEGVPGTTVSVAVRLVSAEPVPGRATS